MINISDDEKRGENTEAAILEAAEKLFMEQGFASTTTMQIAKRAGCNQALVHYYFRTKDNLFEKIFEEKVRFIVTNFLNIRRSKIRYEKWSTCISSFSGVILV